MGLFQNGGFWDGGLKVEFSAKKQGRYSMGIRGEIFSTRVLLQNRTYFFNVKENRMGDLYLNIVESKNRDAGGFERQSVILFAEDLQEFLKGFDDSLRVLEKAIRERKRSGRRADGGDSGGRRETGAGYEGGGKSAGRRESADRYDGRRESGDRRENRAERGDEGPVRRPRRVVAKKAGDGEIPARSEKKSVKPAD
jgi:hypothetical protein